MAVCSAVKANPLLLLNRRKISNGNFCSSIRSRTVYCASSKYAIAEVKNIANSISSITSSPKKKLTAVLLNHDEAQQIRSSTNKDPLNIILKFMMKGLRIVPVVTVTWFLLLGILMMYGQQSALAFSGGVMGGYSFSSSSTSDSSSNWGYSTSSSKTSTNYGVPSIESIAVYVTVLLVITLLFILKASWDIYLRTVNIIKFQVGLLVNGQSLQNDLNRIAKTTDSSTVHGWRHMLEETINSLLQHEKYWMAGSSSSVEMHTNEGAEEYFKRLSTKERRKFSEETLVNLDNIEKECITNKRVNNQFTGTYMVVTIVMAANITSYESDIPTIVHHEDVKKALNKLRRISNTRKIQGLHVLWTPQKENEVLSLNEFRENYPSLKAFKSVPAQVPGN